MNGGGLILLLFLTSAAFAVMAFPLWAIGQCALSRRAPRFKAVWIIAMLLFWPLASVFYALLASGHRTLRTAAVATMVCYAGIGGVMIVGSEMMTRPAARTFSAAREAARHWDVTALAPGERAEWMSSLETLAEEISVPWYRYQEKTALVPFGSLLEGITADGAVSQAEYAAWNKFFALRREQPYAALNKDIRNYVQQIRAGGKPLAVSGGETVAYED